MDPAENQGQEGRQGIWPGASSRCMPSGRSGRASPSPGLPLAAGIRLLCGDVGYGKTEVALRAVMKCILDGKQAAILVPTTVLAQQHYATAVSRFRDFPVKIEVLSRFTPARGQKRILEAAPKQRRGPADPARTSCCKHGVQRPGPAGDRRGTAVRRHPQRGG